MEAGRNFRISTQNVLLIPGVTQVAVKLLQNQADRPFSLANLQIDGVFADASTQASRPTATTAGTVTQKSYPLEVPPHVPMAFQYTGAINAPAGVGSETGPIEQVFNKLLLNPPGADENCEFRAETSETVSFDWETSTISTLFVRVPEGQTGS